ncbi:Yar1p SCDLUD_001154 [Saccharomycodes ludwigii]|uniref:Yar1p n=1 Tax=Saccharomycodes ludwigii TaxID=36035 RepID=UPI001E881949|nr:hypothetical protein SCDLUD_001154 [Saccharomycodes ludwigii]KAH3903513.1 hypothetical protein SCDLUD_001154 [Saccharomycodes ludwigii]
MTSLHSGPLAQEDQDSIIFDARSGDLESLKEIFTTLVHPRLLIDCVDKDTKVTPLHMAAANGHLEVVNYLLKLVKDNSNEQDTLQKWVNQGNNNGNTALHWAALNGQLEVVKCLCEDYNADPFIKNKFNHDPIFEAENSDKEDIETYFLKKYEVNPDEVEKEGEGNENKEVDVTTVQIKEGTEIENVTKEATEALREKTEELSLGREK